MIIVVDDERTFPFGFHVRTVDEARTMIGVAKSIEELWLDHDLGEGGDARALALWLAEEASEGYRFPIEAIYVHSMNPVGADWLVSTLRPWYDACRALLPNAPGRSQPGLG